MAGQNSRHKKNKKNTDRKTSSSTFRRLSSPSLLLFSLSSPAHPHRSTAQHRLVNLLPLRLPGVHTAFFLFFLLFLLALLAVSHFFFLPPFPPFVVLPRNFHFRISGLDHLADYLCTLLQASPNRLHRRRCVAHLSTVRCLVSKRLASFRLRLSSFH